MSPQNRYRIDLKDYSYHCQSFGAENLPPLIVLHGFMGSSDDFAGVMRHLSQHFYCVGIDLPGHGQTQVLGDEHCYGMEAIALSLIHILDDLNLRPCHLLGYSMGGRVALYMAIHYPQYFRLVILESASPGLATESERCDRRTHDHAIAQRLDQEDYERFLDQWYSQPLFYQLRHHPNYDAMRRRRSENDPAELARSLRSLGLGMQPSLWPKIQYLARPTHLIVGEQDLKFVDIGHLIHSKNRAIQLHLVEKAGHAPHLENDRAFLDRVTHILSDH